MDLPKRLREHDYEWAPQDAKALGAEAADKIEELTLAIRNLQHKLNEATDARARERVRGDIAFEFIRMATKDVESE